MLKILNKDHFKAAVAEAKSLGGKSWESFRDSLRRVNGYGGLKHREVRVGPDFVPHSFNFAVYDTASGAGFGRLIYNGGIIRHGAGSGGMAELSITLSPEEYVNWQIHT